MSFTITRVEPDRNLMPGDTIAVYISADPSLEINYLELFWPDDRSLDYDLQNQPTIAWGTSPAGRSAVVGGYFTVTLYDRFWVYGPLPFGTVQLKLKGTNKRTWTNYWAYCTVEVPWPTLTLGDMGFIRKQDNLVVKRLGGTLSIPGRPIPDKRIGLLVPNVGAVGNTYTDQNGSYSFDVGFNEGETVSFIAGASPQYISGECVPGYNCIKSDLITVQFTVPTVYPTRISISAPDRVYVNQLFEISGKLEYQEAGGAWMPLPGRIVALYYDGNKIADLGTQSDGSYSAFVRISKSGTYTLKAVYGGESLAKAKTSGATRIMITRAGVGRQKRF